MSLLLSNDAHAQEIALRLREEHGELTAEVAALIPEFARKYPTEWVLEAAAIAKSKGKDVGYMRGILSNWRSMGRNGGRK